MTTEQERYFKISGAYNVRELGGYRTTTGTVTRWGRFLRADLLGDIPPKSVAALVNYGIKTAIDLRAKDELLQRPSVLARSTEIEYFNHNLLGDDELPDVVRNYKTASGMAGGYAWILEHRQPLIRDALSTLASPGAMPAVFFCAGGTDRTGIIAALLLGLAGVPSETIAQDYHLSAKALVVRWRSLSRPDFVSEEELASGKVQERLARTETMRLTLEYIDGVHGGVEGYTRTIGLTDGQAARLRDALLAQ
jgi:protein-tyrosine phosphatase